MLDRFRFAALGSQSESKIPMRFGRSRGQLDGFFKLSQRLTETPFAPESRAEIVMRFKRIRFQPYRFLEMGDGFLEPLTVQQRIAKVALNFDIPCAQTERLLVFGDGLVETALPVIRQTKARMGIGKCGVLALNPLKQLDRVLRLALLQQRGAQ